MEPLPQMPEEEKSTSAGLDLFQLEASTSKDADDIVAQYLDDKHDVTDSTEVLEYWKQATLQKPSWKPLFDIAKRYLVSPATETDSERKFSFTGRILTPQRSQTSADTLAKYSYIAFNSPKTLEVEQEIEAQAGRKRKQATQLAPTTPEDESESDDETLKEYQEPELASEDSLLPADVEPLQDE
jgi:hypothetical protein